MVISSTDGPVVDLDPGVVDSIGRMVKDLLLLASENPKVSTLVTFVLVGLFIILLVKAWRKPGQ